MNWKWMTMLLILVVAMMPAVVAATHEDNATVASTTDAVEDGNLINDENRTLSLRDRALLILLLLH